MVVGAGRSIEPDDDGGGGSRDGDAPDSPDVVAPATAPDGGNSAWRFAGYLFSGKDDGGVDSPSSSSSSSFSLWMRRPSSSWTSNVGLVGNDDGYGDDYSRSGGGSWMTTTMMIPSILSVLSSMSSMIPSANVKDESDERALASSSTSPSLAFLPRFASRFRWATKSTSTTRQHAVVDVGRWDRIANFYYPCLSGADPLFGMGVFWPQRHPNDGIVSSGNGLEVGPCRKDSCGTRNSFSAAPSVDIDPKDKHGRRRMGWCWWCWRGTRPSETSVDAAWSTVFAVQRQLMLASAMEVENQDEHDDDESGEGIDNNEGGDKGANNGEPDDDNNNDGEIPSDDDRLYLQSSRSFGSDTSYDVAVHVHRSSSAQRSLTSAEIDDGVVPGDPPRVDMISRGAIAARLAEGALRAYRDLTLDEATELHSALHHWTFRWMHPLLAWLEAGPYTWFLSPPDGGGNYLPPHIDARKKVGQIQAVLARRCAVIGELQQHLWRASWAKGVAEWGVLGGGVGGEWTSVVGEFSRIDVADTNVRTPRSSPSTSTGNQKQRIEIFSHSNLIGTNVSNSPGGSIVMDQNALVTWSVDAMRVVRDQLYRARRDSGELPFVDHWPRERIHFRGDEGKDNGGVATSTNDLPLWASSCNDDNRISEVLNAEAKEVSEATSIFNNDHSSVVVSDLGKLTDEVSALLQSIDLHLKQQKDRRLDRLRPPSRLRRNWYLVAIGVPVGAFAMYKLTREHGGFFLLNTLITKLADIYRDHVSEPLESIYQELFTKSGRMNVTDRKARVDAISSLKRMIRSWLEESFPKMPLEEMQKRVETMDISLLEARKEASIKNIYELNSVVWMSLIEMQFIKKELLNALVAMDELMGSNEINMRIAAMTPAFILLYSIRRGFQLLLYGFFRIGKTKEQIYGSFRQTVLDIERLLLMRDNPPLPLDPLVWGSSFRQSAKSSAFEPCKSQTSQALTAEDLGMLLLHIHECRNILWESRRRFRSDVIRNIEEDLAELAGERGPVSISQQLAIISRMTRTYPFMKVGVQKVIY